MKFDLNYLYKTSNHTGLSADFLAEAGKDIASLVTKIDARQQGFYECINDASLHDEILTFAESKKGQHEHVVVIGIGGSALGTICLQQSLRSQFVNETSDGSFPTLHVIDNIDPDLLADIESRINIATTLFVVVTKSGGTPESLAMFFHFKQKVIDSGGDVTDQFVVITDPKKGLLRKIATDEGIPAFPIPPNVGGRFSVLTAVGLVPAALIGIDIEALIKGAQDMVPQWRNAHWEENISWQIAVIQHHLYTAHNVNMTVMMPYAQRLVKFADWYRQLLAESIGKSHNDAGEKIHVGITPINALGVTDQHSQSQLYNDGPNDKFYLFIKTHTFTTDFEIPALYPDEEKVSFLKGVKFSELMHTEQTATIDTFLENNRPLGLIEIESVNEHTLGQLFMLFESSTAFLGELFELNAFDQPGVERAKNLTKQYLQK